MKKFLAAALLSFSAVLSANSVWTPVAAKVQESLVFLEMSDANGEAVGACSGFMIDSVKHHILTAGHCDAPKILVDGTPAFKIFKDERKDLMVLRAYNVDRPSLKLAPKGPDVGDEIASMGFGFALEQPMFRIAHVSSTRIEIEDLSGPFIMLDANVIPGMSGGPIVNQLGQVEAIVQRGGDGLSIGVGADTIKDRTGRFWGQ